MTCMTTTTAATAKQISYITSLLPKSYHEATLMVEAGLSRRTTLRNISAADASALIDYLKGTK